MKDSSEDNTTKKKHRQDKNFSVRLDNLKHFIRSRYKKSRTRFAEFKKEYYAALQSICDHNEDEIDTKITQASRAYYEEINISDTIREDIEKAFKLTKGSLDRKRPEKIPAFILIECDGFSSQKVFDFLKGYKLVDEVAMVAGDADVFVRVYGSHREIKDLLMNDLYNNDVYRVDKDTIRVHRTKTYFSYVDAHWQRYPPSGHKDYVYSWP